MPNPSNGLIHIQTDFSNNPEPIIFEISNLNGQVLIREKLSTQESKSIITKFLQPGLYFLTEINQKGAISQKFVVN